MRARGRGTNRAVGVAQLYGAGDDDVQLVDHGARLDEDAPLRHLSLAAEAVEEELELVRREGAHLRAVRQHGARRVVRDHPVQHGVVHLEELALLHHNGRHARLRDARRGAQLARHERALAHKLAAAQRRELLVADLDHHRAIPARMAAQRSQPHLPRRPHMRKRLYPIASGACVRVMWNLPRTALSRQQRTG